MHVLQSRVLMRPTDFDRSVRFYEDGVGLVRYRDWGDPPHRGVVYFLGGGYLELSESGSGQPPAGVRLWVQVADAEQACRELRGAGIEIVQDPEEQPWGLIEALIHDPDGLPIVVVETPVTHPVRRRR